MSKVKIQGHASGTGVLTVTAPNTSTDRTITLPDSTGTLATTADTGVAGITSSADATAITIDSSERVGVGTASPTEKLQVHGAIRSTNNATTTLADSGNFYYIPTADDASNPRTVISAVGTSSVGGHVTFKTGTSSSNTEKLRIQSGGGISFNGDTAAANALDDYEYGEFDASFSSSGASFSYTARKGYYTKIGNRVFYNIYMQLDGSQTFTSNQVTITGLPFTSNGGGHFNSSAICETRYVDFDSGFTALAGRIGANTTSILLLEIGDGQAGNVLRSDQLSSSSGQVFINGSYAI
jgi:hypothetical protein